MNRGVRVFFAVIGGVLLIFGEALGARVGGEEVVEASRRYRYYELSRGFYESHEMRPMGQGEGQPKGMKTGMYHRSRLADAHQGILFYAGRRCEACHPDNAASKHGVRGNLTCRQCHGSEPIAGIAHYYSPMNPIRRHAYVCARCHEGAGASFATYRIHEPIPGSMEAKQSFPSLHYTHRFMLGLLLGVLGLFSLHALMLGLRELFSIRRPHP